MAQYVVPVGLHFECPVPELDEGYDVQWRDDEDPPHYAFCVQASVLRMERLIRDALSCLPPYIHAVLEVLRPDAELDRDPEGPSHHRWTSGLVHREEVERVLDRYAFQLLHDGMVGFGVYDPDSALEWLLDDHKLLNLFAPRLDPFERLLKRHGVPAVKQVETLIDLPHEHFTLTEVPGRGGAAIEHLGKRRYDVDWFAEAIRRRLAMVETPSHMDGERG